jgi:acyl-CoA reductase-like NAD-dependent aldehyde dehydrogenase
LQQSYNELNGARNRIQFFLDNSEKYLAEEWITKEGLTKEKVTYEPLGVIANISAWNYPYLVGVNVFIPALIGGNAVLYKPSEYATLTGMHIERLMLDAGIPEGVFQCVVGKADTGQVLLSLPLDGYFFTGSYATGKKIAEATAGKLVPVQMELGGKDPLYVMDDVQDITQVAAAALEGVIYNAGQSCCAVERVYVHTNVYAQFCEAIKAEAAKMKVGNPMDNHVDMGPLCRPQQVEVLNNQVADALEKGASLLFQSSEMPGEGFYFPITLLTHVNHTMAIMKDESFGPVVGIQQVANDEEAISLMQDTDYGLTAAVYGTDKTRAENIMHKMRTGTVYLNCCDRVSAGLPWSGRGYSGIGSTLGTQGIRAFVQPKGWHVRG